MGRPERSLQAVVLCDSYLPRFRPLTEDKPRCLLPLANMPLIEYTLEFLVNCGVKEVYLMCCSHAEQVSEYIKKSKWSSSFVPFKLSTIELPNTLSVGDAMRDIDTRGIITSDFLLISGDVVCNIDFDPIWEAHVNRKKEDKNCIMSMVLRQASALHRTRSNRTGLFIVDNISKRLVSYQKSVLQKEVDVDANELLRIPEVAFRNDLIDCRIDICSMDVPALFTENFDYEHLRDDFVRGVLTSDLLGKTIYAHIVEDGYAARVESVKTYKSVTKDIVSRYAYPLVVDSNEMLDQTYSYQRGHIYKERNVILSQSCTIGMETVVGGDTSVGQDTIIESSVVGRRCRIGKDVVIKDSYIWEDAVVEDGANVTGAIVGSGAVIGSGAVVERNSIVSFGYAVAPNAVVPSGSKLSVHKKHHRRPTDGSEGTQSEGGGAVSGAESGLESDALMTTDSESEAYSAGEDLVVLVDDLYVSDDSFSSLDDHKTSHSANAKKPRRKSRTMSTTSNVSVDDGDEDADEEFMREAIASINRSIVDKHPQDVAMLELSTLRMTMNAPHEKVQEAVISALITHIGHLITQADVKAVTTTVFRTWTKVLKRITFDMTGQARLASYIEHDCNGMLQGEHILAFALATLYDTDVISEDAVSEWWQTPEAGPKVRTLASQWVDWLMNAEEESDDE